MIALLASELRRISSRRLVRTVAAVAVLGILIAGAIVTVRSRPGVGVAGDLRFHLSMLTGILEGTSPILVIAAWLLGASFIGADWHAGTVTTLLTWEPRRTRVLMAKLAACMVAVFVLVLLLQALLGLTLSLAAALRGTTAGAGGPRLREAVGVGLRTAALSCVAAAIGFSIAAVARNTAAALGVGFVYVVVVENLVRGLRPQWRGWLMGDNAAVFISGGNPVFSFGRSVIQAGLLLGIYAAVLVVVALAVFRTRDV